MTGEIENPGGSRTKKGLVGLFGATEPPRGQHAATDAASPFDPGKWMIAALVLLVVISDILFWRQQLGLSLVLFGWALFAGVCVIRRKPPNVRTLGFLIATSLPVIEYVQPLSMFFFGVGLLGSIVLHHSPPTTNPRDIAAKTATLLARIPIAFISDTRRALASKRRARRKSSLSELLRDWGLPIGGTLILLVLLTEANPILSDWLLRLANIDVSWEEQFLRSLLWVGTALVAWPLITEPPSASATLAPNVTLPTWGSATLNEASVLRSLLLFNVILAVQTSLDVLVLIGSGQLPDGVTFSEYARGGAYPLLAATLLGGIFALMARRFVEGHRGLASLLYLWLFQNIFMSLACLYRLSMYVDAYGLAFMRVYAMIWIVLVACGLALTGWQIFRRKPNLWLIVRAGAIAIGVLYVSAFVSFSDVIARHNLQRDVRIDWSFLINDLPPTAIPTVLENAIERGCPRWICDAALAAHQPIPNWRSWGLRRWRVDRRMDALDLSEMVE